MTSRPSGTTQPGSRARPTMCTRHTGTHRAPWYLWAGTATLRTPSPPTWVNPFGPQFDCSGLTSPCRAQDDGSDSHGWIVIGNYHASGPGNQTQTVHVRLSGLPATLVSGSQTLVTLARIPNSLQLAVPHPLPMGTAVHSVTHSADASEGFDLDLRLAIDNHDVWTVKVLRPHKTDDGSDDIDPRCRLNGNWTDASNKTRIEIFQPPAFNYLNWRSSKYGGAFSEGRSNPSKDGAWDHSGWLLFYETQTQLTMTIGKSKRVANAPDCSWIEVDGQEWCRFPAAGVRALGFPFPRPGPPTVSAAQVEA